MVNFNFKVKFYFPLSEEYFLNNKRCAQGKYKRSDIGRK